MKVTDPASKPIVKTSEPTGNDFNLGVAQIIVTAATPMGDDTGKHFPPVESSEKYQPTSPAVQLIEDDRNIIPEEDEEDDWGDNEDEIETNIDPPNFPAPTIIKPVPPPPPTDKAAEIKINDAVDDKKESVEISAEATTMNLSSNDVHEHFFEANFDEAFQEDAFKEEPNAPKVVTGGRASIPDELAPHQLARLQNLKESNA